MPFAIAQIEIERAQLQGSSQRLRNRRGPNHGLRVDREQAEQQRGQQSGDAVGGQAGGDLVSQHHRAEVKHHHQRMGTDRIQSEDLVIKSQPDILQGTVIMALRKMSGVPEPPTVIDESLP